jgi:hypothetical protein
VKQGTLVVELANPQLKKVVWWGVGEDTLTGDRDKSSDDSKDNFENVLEIPTTPKQVN